MKNVVPTLNSPPIVEQPGVFQVRPLDRSSVEPLYRQLASTLLYMIETGELAVAQRLPSETVLMASFGVSRITVRQANELLVQYGKIISHRGKGTYVAGRVLRHDLDALQGFYAALRSQGIEPKTNLIEWSADAGAFDDARPAGTDLPVRLKRLYSIDDRPFAMVVGYLPSAAAALGKLRAEHLSVYEILADFMGVRVARASVAIRCEAAPKEVAVLLGLQKADMVLVMERQSFAANNQSCEFMRIYILPERYEFRLSVTGPFEIAGAVHPIPLSSKLS
jgi:GntR family transcriptional regulator